MNLLDKLEEVICDIEGLSALLTLSGVSVNDNTASSAMICAGNQLNRTKETAEEVMSALESMNFTMQGVKAK